MRCAHNRCHYSPGTTIGLWQQCGGKGNTGAGNCGRTGYGPCVDAAWTSPTCASGSKCVRDNEWWWQCEPSTTSGGTTTTTTSSGECAETLYRQGSSLEYGSKNVA